VKTETIHRLYELSSSGDFDGQRPLLADNYRHHLVGQGVDFNSADETLEALKATAATMPMTWMSDHVEEHGVFAVSFSTGEITGIPPFKAVNVYRFEGDVIAEGWVFVPPLG
jgi:hypothetical protein